MFIDSQVTKCISHNLSLYIQCSSEVFILCSLNTQWQLQKCEMSHGQVCVEPKRLFISLSVISLKGKMLKTLPYCLNQQNISHSSSSPFLLVFFWLRGACKHIKIEVSSECATWQQTQNLKSNCKFFQNVSLYLPCHKSCQIIWRMRSNRWSFQKPRLSRFPAGSSCSVRRETVMFQY